MVSTGDGGGDWDQDAPPSKRQPSYDSNPIWWALIFTLKATDTQAGRYPIGTYALGQNPVGGNGLRQYPYSYDLSIDPLSYRSIKTNNESHGAGAIWASALWDLNWLLIGKYGFDGNWSHGYSATDPSRDGGNNLAMKLIMDALKLQPSNPSFLAGRDAILAADVALNGGLDAEQIWNAFARRGMGLSASDGGSPNSTNISEGFDVPAIYRDPSITSQSPSFSAVLTVPPARIDINFSEEMDPTSFSIAADVLSFTSADGVEHKGQITGVGWLNNNSTLRLIFSPQTTDGQYKLILGPGILAADDHSPMDQNRDGTSGSDPEDEYTAKFRYDSLVLAVSSTSPANNAIVTLPLTTLDLNFNEAIDPASVDISDLFISRGTVTDAVALDGDTIRYTLSGIAGETNLSFSLGSGSISDAFGNPNAAYSGTFSIDNSAVPFSGAFTSVPPDGSFVFQGTTSTNLTFVGDVDTFHLDLEAGQTLRALLTPATGMQAKIELFSPQDTLLSSATAGALTPVADIAAAGTYKLAVTLLGGSTGTARVTVNLNAATEAEPGTAGVAQNLNSTFRPIFEESSADRVTLVGASVGGSTDAQDLYSFDLAAGQSVSIVWSGSTTLAPALNLLAPDGTLLAASASNTASMPSTISDFIAPVTGSYLLGFGPKNNVTYNLSITRDAAIEVEPNDTAATANLIASRSISGSRFVVGNLAAGGTDYFSVRAKAGDVLTIQTSTPGDAPKQPSNIFDPKLVLFGSDGAQIASDDNSAPDGRNARLTYTVTADATLFIQLTGASATTTGNYALEVAGATAPTTAPFLTVTSPTSGTRLNVSPGTVNVTFSQAIRVDTLSASDLLVDGTPATAVTISGSNLLSFTIPTGLAEGNHTITMAPGAVIDIHGNPSAALSSGFVVDTTGPRIISTSIQKDMVIPTLADVVFKIQFDEPLDLRYFVLDNRSDYSLRNNTGDGTSTGGGVWTFDTATNTLTISYPTQGDGNYVFTLYSGGNGIVDLAGNGLDGETPLWPIPTNRSGDGVPGGNFVTNFRIDSVTTPFPALSQVGLPGSQMYSGQVWLNLDSATDVDSFTLNLDAGQILSISDSPSGGELRPQLRVRDPSGTIIGSASGPYNQSGAAINAIPINVAGTYTITGSVYNNSAGSIGTSIMTVVLNATFGSQLRWPNGGSPTPEPIRFVPLGAEPNRFVGSVFSRSQDQSSDPYTFTLGAGDTASLAYQGTFSGIDFYLMNGANTTYITSGNALSNQTSTTQTYLAVVRGIRVDSTVNPDYELTIFKNADFDTEPGNDHASANVLRSQIIAGEQAAAGYIDLGDVDSYVVPVLAGQTITLQTSTPGDGPGRFDNTLNPKLALYSSDGALLASDDNSAADGHNARIIYTPTATATLYLDLLSTSSAATQGEYVLSITNATHPTTTFNATINVPSRTNAPPNSVGVSFDGAVDLSSVQASDLLLDGVPAASFSNNGTYGLSFTFSNSISAGTHTFTLSSGAIRDLYQTPVQSTSATFSLDTTAPRIINSTIQEGDELPSGDITVTLTFDEPIDVTSIDSNAVTLHAGTHAVDYAPAAFNFDSTGKILTLNFSKLLEDSYTLTLLSSHFQDLVGNALDGETTAATWPIPPNRSGNGAAGGDFTVDFGVDQSGVASLSLLAAHGRLGSLAHRTAASGVLDRAADTDTFALSLEAGLPLTVRLAATGFASSLTILDPSQNSIGTFNAVSSGQPALAQNITLTAGGTYTFIVASTTAVATSGLYTLDVIANAKLESESNGGASNNTQATAQTLTLSPISGAASAPVLGGALYGSFETSAIDFYALNLSAGDRMSAVVTTPTAANAVLTLLDSNGLSLTSSTSGGSGLSASIRTGESITVADYSGSAT